MSDKKTELPEEDIEKPLATARKILESDVPDDAFNRPENYDSDKETDQKVL